MTEEQKKRMNEIKWLHQIELEPGVFTPGLEMYPEIKEAYLLFPTDLKGKKVVDLGAWDGKYSFKAEKEGAKEVWAVDSWDGTGSSGPNGIRPSIEGLYFAQEILDSEVITWRDDIYDFLDTTYLESDATGVFNIALCYGVLYHVPDMMRLLTGINRILPLNGELYLESELGCMNVDYPSAQFLPEGCDGDETNFWLPNMHCVKGMLKRAGFTDKKESWSPFKTETRTRVSIFAVKTKELPEPSQPNPPV